MRAFGDWTLLCPKCEALMGEERSRLAFREASSHYGNTVGDYDYHQPARLEVSCPSCGWSYDMKPADAPKDEPIAA